MTCYVHNLTPQNDPTGTLELRERFRQNISGRFERVRGAVRRTVGYENDAFNLSQNADKIEGAEAYDFPTDQQKINAFVRDLKEWLNNEVLEIATFSEKKNGDHWTSEFVRNAYIIGHTKGVYKLRNEGVSQEVLELQDLMDRPTHAKTLEDLYTRTYENLKGITDDAADEIRRELTLGFAEGENPRKIADRLTGKLNNLQKNRAETLARTEVLNAANQSTLNTYKDAGVEVVGHSYWNAADDSRVCPFCSRLDGVPIKISEADTNTTVDWAIKPDWKPQTWRLVPPAHPSCRCTLRPAVGASADDLDPLEDRLSNAFGRTPNV